MRVAEAGTAWIASLKSEGTHGRCARGVRSPSSKILPNGGAVKFMRWKRIKADGK
jgi:hypothetical protein